MSSKPDFKVGQVWLDSEGVPFRVGRRCPDVNGLEKVERIPATPMRRYVLDQDREYCTYIGEIPKPEPEPVIGASYKHKGSGQVYVVTVAPGQCGAVGDGVVLQRTVGVSLAVFDRDYEKLA